jgi:spore germination protein KB
MSLEKGILSSRQVMFLVTNMIFATEIQFVPALLTMYAGQDAWVVVLIVTIVGFLFGVPIISLGLRFPGKTPVEYGMDLLGKWGGRALGMLLGLFYFYVAAVVVRELADHLVIAVMPRTPLVVFIALYVFAMAYGVYLGLEVFARVGEILYPLFLVTLLAGIFFLIPQLNWDLLKPVLDHSPLELLRGSLTLLAFYGEGLAILFLIPCMRRPEQAPGLNLKITLLLNIPLLVMVVTEVAMFGALETSRILFPSFELVKMISVAGFFERVESFLLAFWVTTVCLKVALLYYTAMISFAQSLNLRDHRPLVWPGAVSLAALAVLVFSDITQARGFLAKSWPVFGLSVEGGVPILLYSLALLRKKGVPWRGRQKNEETN